MPVTTRAQSRLQAVEPLHARKQFMAIKQPPKGLKSTATTQSSVLNRASSDRESAQISSDRDPPEVTSNKRPSTTSSKQKPHQEGTEYSPSDPSGAIETDSWPCLKCSCQEAVFERLIDSCVTCGHTMDDHELDQGDPWYPHCDYLCKRENLVKSVLQHTRDYGVMVIRATPMVGKTALLRLLGLHILREEKDLEPVYLHRENKEDRKNLLYDDFLQQKKSLWEERNMRVRPCNPNARPIYLIDEAQESYEEKEF